MRGPPLPSSYNTQPASYELTLDYSHWTTEQILRAALPDDMHEVTSSFETVGHIAHMNLRQDQIPFKRFIGEVGYLARLTAVGYS